jgi:hypothetical protein
MRRGVTPTSVPLSGFFNLSAVSWQASSFVALFRTTTVPGIPLQSFPLAEIAHPSRGRCSLAVIHCRAETHCLRPCHRQFHRRRRFHAVAWIRCRLWTPLSANLIASFPVVLDHLQRSRLFPPASPASKLCSLCESVRAGLGCPASAADALLGFCPSRVFALRASDPLTRPDSKCPNTSPPPKDRTRDPRDLAAPRAG